MSVTTVAALPRLALLQTVMDAFAILWRERARCVPAIVIVSAVCGLVQALLVYVPFSNLRLAVFCLGHLAVGACLAYVWCRLVLLNEWVLDGGGVRTRFRWAQFSGFLYYYTLICVGVVTLAAAFAVSLATLLGVGSTILLCGMAFGLLVARLAFVLPATALQLPTTFYDSWIQTTGQGIRLWLIYGCAAVPAVGIVAVLGFVSTVLSESVAIAFMLSFAAWCAGLVGTLAVTTMAALAYERTVGLPERARRLDRMVGA